MSTQEYRLFEDHIISQFPVNSCIFYQGKEYVVSISGKPTPQGISGECKTDVYILLVNPKDTNDSVELKISCKLSSSNEFQENKLTELRAFDYFGEDAKRILETATKNLQNIFENDIIDSPTGIGSKKGGYLTLGWLVDITTKWRRKSEPFIMTEKEIRDLVYIGRGLPDSKKNAIVCGVVIPDSGLANMMLVSERKDISSYNDVLKQLIPIESYPIKEHFIILKAINFFPGALKYQGINPYDGNRPFAVRVHWDYDELTDSLVSTLDYADPLKTNGMAMLCMKKLNSHSLNFHLKNNLNIF
ncbi:hypothetical protein [Enterococcus termitis]|uniref:Uncharacterized protein n=1 Tax=Enterococcus termitis TaxID=332950 RepID=A0A1E5GY09_9ENTE|nr:hypothetical protein [Enterococcus termitis]OEG17611.1 hypothetical protein BCR25_18035 [Enterococcus termitis]